MESPLVSVCIPAYNNADTILETIQSVLTQTYQNLELIVVDDRSTDDTYQVVKTFAKQAGDDRLHLYQNEKNLGMAGNWNHCMELCKGDFIKLLCADDLIHETLLAREVEIMERYPEANLVQTDTRFVDMHGKTTGYYKRYHASGLVEGRKAPGHKERQKNSQRHGKDLSHSQIACQMIPGDLQSPDHSTDPRKKEQMVAHIFRCPYEMRHGYLGIHGKGYAYGFCYFSHICPPSLSSCWLFNVTGIPTTTSMTSSAMAANA